MDNKELDEILQRYAESTRNDKDVAFKKLNEKPIEEKRSNKRLKPRYIFATAICAIIIVLCIILPITLKDDSPQNSGPRYCLSIDIVYNQENSFSDLTEKCGSGAFYPTCVAEEVLFESISSLSDSSLHGAYIGYIIEDDIIIFADVNIIPKTHILEKYEEYFTLPDQEQWKSYSLKVKKAFNEETQLYDMQIYFADAEYDYFIFASSEEEMAAEQLLNILYA